VIVGLACLLAAVAGPASAEPIRGAGSTFAAPVISAWGQAYKDARADGGDFFTLDWTIDYEPVGSLAGIMRLQEPAMDFAATDAPLSPPEVEKRGYVQFPIVMGGIAVVVNVGGVESGALRLDGPVLAGIFSGDITTWSDPAVAALNPGLALPERPIRVLRRQDGSGSTFVFTSYLSETSPEWKSRFGAAPLIEWAAGQGVEGTGDLIARAAATADSITYVEYGQVRRAGLPTAQLKNSAGEFVLPSPESFQAGLAGIAWDPAQHFIADTTNMPGAGAYPMGAVTYAVIPKDRASDRVRRVMDLFRLAYRSGGEQAVALGYIPVPAALSAQIEDYWSASFAGQSN
jgi:phosphate transport system substrate-binding protein